MSEGIVDISNAEIVPRGDYADILRKIHEEGKCPFCKDQLLRHHDKPILWESPGWIVTTNFKPYNGARMHFLLITTEHVERIEDLPGSARIEFFENYDRLSEAYGFTGASILWRSGDTNMTGGSVNHLHAQVIVGHPKEVGAETITGLLGFRPA